MLNNLLLYRMIIVNCVGAALLVWVWLQGYAGILLKGDISGVSHVIIALFVIGLISAFRRAIKVSKAMNELKAGGLPDGTKFEAKAAHLGDISEWLVTLGLIGNVIGFAIALHGMNTDFGSASGAQVAAASLLSGMQVAFYSTLVGAVFALWLAINRRMLDTATQLFLADIQKRKVSPL